MHISIPRKLAAILVAASAVVVALLPTVLTSGSRVESGPRQPPWQMPPLTVQPVGGGPGSLNGLKGSSAALIYVDRECFHCKAELERWGSLAQESGFAKRVWVIASPSSVVEAARWVPRPLRSRTVRDADGSVGRMLGINAVPATFWVDATDTVRIVHIGQSSKRQLTNNILAVTNIGTEQ